MIEAMSTAAVSREWVGRLADGRFPLLRWLGGSEPSGVFLTELADLTDQSGPSQRAVIKLVPAEIDDGEARLAAWEAATTLSHPNLMKVYTHGRCEIEDIPCIYVVTEFADEVLAEILFERPLTTKETRDLLGPTLDALRYLHANGLVHGRLNPSNIMAAGDNLKLTTYSVCSVSAAVTSSSTRTVCDAPETEYGPIGPASDVWSLGATLVEVLTKYPPQWNRARTAEPTVPESMPEPFASIARKCLCSDPARRITLDEIAARLEPNRAPSTPSRPQEEPAPASTRSRRIAIPLAIAALVLAGARNLVRAVAPRSAAFACSAGSKFTGRHAGQGASSTVHCDAVSDRYPERNRNHNSGASHAPRINNSYASGVQPNSSSCARSAASTRRPSRRGRPSRPGHEGHGQSHSRTRNHKPCHRERDFARHYSERNEDNLREGQSFGPADGG